MTFWALKVDSYGNLILKWSWTTIKQELKVISNCNDWIDAFSVDMKTNFVLWRTCAQSEVMRLTTSPGGHNQRYGRTSRRKTDYFNLKQHALIFNEIHRKFVAHISCLPLYVATIYINGSNFSSRNENSLDTWATSLQLDITLQPLQLRI